MATNPERILDIGTGTGLLSLMLAQASQSLIDAIELDRDAAVQARENADASPWRERLRILQGDARALEAGNAYPLIISNPPFFHNDLKSNSAKRNLALHSSELQLDELTRLIIKNLAANGNFAVLLPFHRKEEMIGLAAESSFSPAHIADVRQTERHGFFRTMLLFAQQPLPATHESITIREREAYSPAFVELLKDFYLNL